ncbi:MAG TPA: helix-turn-helix domain-containing protein [Baekduia sp.]|nr:helix-turn-helix domain-containing protein [Baekduia sp.]
MEILSPEDRVVLWRATIDAEGRQREALLHAIGKDVVDSLGELDLYGDTYAQLVLDTLQTLDDAGLFARDSMRRCLEELHEPEGGVDLLAAEMSGLLRDAAGVDHLGADRRVRAMEMASEWREHVLDRRRPEPQTISVGEVAALYGVTTQAVYKWLRDERIEATRGPGGSWLIPAAQFERDRRPATSRRKLDELKQHLVRVHDGAELPSEEELTADMRRDDDQ